MPNYPCTGQLLCAEIIARIRETVTSSSYAVISPIHTDTCSLEFHLITHPLNHCSRGNRDGYISENNYALRPILIIYIYMISNLVYSSQRDILEFFLSRKNDS